MGDDSAHVPGGWDYNPAAWLQRVPIVVLALVGFGVAMVLSLYQWGVTDRVWEPFFGRGSHAILRESEISKLTMRYLLVPDAFLGAVAYLADAMTGVIGGRARWRTLPWLVVLFGVLVGPLGFVSIFLVIAQPVFYDAWCTLCLASAVVSVLMIGPAMDEVLASLQYIGHARRSGRSGWWVFWGLDNGPLDVVVRRPRKRLGYGWAQLVVMLLGLWLMLAPAVLGYDNGGAAAMNDRIVGPVVATLATVAIWEVTRSLRWVNVVLGLWLIVGVWVIGGETVAAINSTATGVGIVALSVMQRWRVVRYGEGWWGAWRAVRGG